MKKKKKAGKGRFIVEYKASTIRPHCQLHKIALITQRLFAINSSFLLLSQSFTFTVFFFFFSGKMGGHRLPACIQHGSIFNLMCQELLTVPISSDKVGGLLMYDFNIMIFPSANQAASFCGSPTQMASLMAFTESHYISLQYNEHQKRLLNQWLVINFILPNKSIEVTQLRITLPIHLRGSFLEVPLQ